MRRLLPVALLLAACARAPEPSPDYAEARRRHAAVVAAHPQDAAARPEIEEVLQLLARVPAGSADAPAAAELRARIDAERKGLAEERARRAEAVARVEAPIAAPPSSAGPATPTALATPAAPGLQLAAGAKLAELAEKGGGCFERKASEVEIGTGEKMTVGEAWGLKAGAECEERFPPQRGQWLFFAKGAYLGSHPAAAVKVETRRPERSETVDAVPLPGGGYGRKQPDGTVVPLPPDAKLETVPVPPPSGRAK